MGSVYGALGADCYYSREKKRFYVKSAALAELDEALEPWADDFTPNDRGDIGKRIDKAFK